MRSKHYMLERAVIDEARKVVDNFDACGWTHWGDLVDAVKALNAHVAAMSGRGARYARSGPETSEQSARLAGLVQRTVREQIVALLAHVPPLAAPGYTDLQLEKRLGASHQTVSSARNWLVETGWLEDSGQRRKNPSGRMAAVWQLTPAGRAQLAKGD